MAFQPLITFPTFRNRLNNLYSPKFRTGLRPDMNKHCAFFFCLAFCLICLICLIKILRLHNFGTFLCPRSQKKRTFAWRIKLQLIRRNSQRVPPVEPNFYFSRPTFGLSFLYNVYLRRFSTLSKLFCLKLADTCAHLWGWLLTLS